MLRPGRGVAPATVGGLAKSTRRPHVFRARMIGEAFGNYTITAKLGSGTMGVVFRAEHVRIARTAAIKVLIPELAQNASGLQRFFNEARATSLIRHPGIVGVFDCGVDATGRAYIVMENLDGETLAARLERSGEIPWAAACAIARQVAEAIAAAHDNGIVHRDLKPENVFLVGDHADPEIVGPVKVLDFGIAKLLAADASVHLTMRGTVLGTPEYMAPEQCGGADDIDQRADIYALGIILFEMLNGEPPFLAETVQELFVGHMFHPIPPIGERVPGLPAWLADLLTRMLAKRREDRPASMHEIARALRAGVTTAPNTPRTATSRRARRAAPILVAIAGAAALAAALWNASRSSARPAPARPARATTLPAPPQNDRPAPVDAPPAIVVPAQATAAIPPAGAAPPARKRARAVERPQRAARPEPQSAPTHKHLVDTDGIVDL